MIYGRDLIFEIYLTLANEFFIGKMNFFIVGFIDELGF
jgi:hypothetical protein